jgi:hypothetical protein
VEAGRPSCAAIRRYPIPPALACSAVPITAVVSARRDSTAPSNSTGVPPQELHRLVEAAASASPTPSHGFRGPARVPTGAARRRIPGRPARLRPGPPRPAAGPRSRSSRYRFGTAHERGLSRPGAAEASWCWTDPVARSVHCGDSRRVARRHRDDVPTRQERFRKSSPMRPRDKEQGTRTDADRRHLEVVTA